MDYVNQKGLLKSSQVNLTKHAYERYHLRINKSHNREQAIEWTTKALNNGKYISNSNGRSTYEYNQTQLVVDKHMNVITIMKDEPEWESIKDTRSDIEEYIIKKLRKEVRPLITKDKETQISIYEKEINKLKTNNPKTKEYIQKTIDELLNNKENNITKIQGIIRTAKKYYVKPNDIVKNLESYEV